MRPRRRSQGVGCVVGDSSRRVGFGHTRIFDTVPEALLVTQMLVPSNANPCGPLRPVTVAVTVFETGSIFDTSVGLVTATQMLVPSNATQTGLVPTAKVAVTVAENESSGLLHQVGVGGLSDAPLSSGVLKVC